VSATELREVIDGFLIASYDSCDFYKFTGNPGQDVKIFQQRYQIDLVNNRTQEFQRNKFYLCVDIEKIKRYKFKDILKNTGANTQAYQQHEPKFFDSIIENPSHPSIDEWAAYLVYLRNLIPNINLINRRHSCEAYNLQVKFGNRPLIPVDSSCDANFCDGDIAKNAKDHSRSIIIQNNNHLSKTQKGQLVRQTTD
jgi:hypothetical protein